MAAIFTYRGLILSMDDVFLVRYNGKLITIRSRSFEPERMTTDIAWIQIKEDVSPEEAYRRWFERQRRISRLLQQ
jgi:hypothetical protein